MLILPPRPARDCLVCVSSGRARPDPTHPTDPTRLTLLSHKHEDEDGGREAAVAFSSFSPLLLQVSVSQSPRVQHKNFSSYLYYMIKALFLLSHPFTSSSSYLLFLLPAPSPFLLNPNHSRRICRCCRRRRGSLPIIRCHLGAPSKEEGEGDKKAMGDKCLMERDGMEDLGRMMEVSKVCS